MSVKPVRRVQSAPRYPDSHSFYTRPMQPIRVPAAAPRPAPQQMRPLYAAVPRPLAPTYSTPDAPRQNSRPASLPRRNRPNTRSNWWLWAFAAAVGTFMLAVCTIVALGAVMLYGGSGVLQGVSVAGIDVSGQSRAEAARTLQESWAGGGIVLRDGNRTMPVEPAMLGITLDADASADAAIQYGRAYGGLTAAIEALVSGAALEPVLRIDENAAANGLQSLAEQVSLPAVNADVRLVNGKVQERPASQGRALDVGMTLARLQADPAR